MPSLRSFTRLALLVGAGCTASISASDRGDLLTGAQATASAADPDMQLTLLMTSCSEISSCAGSCQQALASVAKSAPEDRGVLFAHCSDDFKAKRDQPGVTADSWFVGYYRAYAARAWPSLTPLQRGDLEVAFTKIALAAPAKHPLRALADPLP